MPEEDPVDNPQNPAENPANDAGSSEEVNKFEHLDIQFAHCFGSYENTSDSNDPESYEENASWLKLAEQSVTEGWRSIDSDQLEKSLAEDVDQSYYNIVTLEVKNVADEVSWTVKFVNDKSLWKLEIKDSPDAEVLDDDKINFFKSDKFLEEARKCGDLLDKAKSKFEQLVKSHLENGEMLDVDEVKLSAILFWLNDKQFIENFRTGRYIY